MKMSNPEFKVTGPDGEDMLLPAKWEVCGRCHGNGVHDHSAFSNGLREEETSDPDFMEDYRRGAYDVRCEECDGQRVVAVPDSDRLSAQQQRALTAHCEYLGELRAERRMRERGIEF